MVHRLYLGYISINISDNIYVPCPQTKYTFGAAALSKTYPPAYMVNMKVTFEENLCNSYISRGEFITSMPINIIESSPLASNAMVYIFSEYDVNPIGFRYRSSCSSNKTYHVYRRWITCISHRNCTISSALSEIIWINIERRNDIVYKKRVRAFTHKGLHTNTDSYKHNSKQMHYIGLLFTSHI